MDPTYVKEEIAANPEWQLAFDLSEILNDGAPIGWSRYTSTAKCLLSIYNMRRKDAKRSTGGPRKVISEELSKKILDMYDNGNGLIITVIAKRCGCGVPTVQKVLADNNVTINKARRML